MYKPGHLLFELVPRHESVDGFIDAMLSLLASSNRRIVDSAFTLLQTVFNHSRTKHQIKMLNSNMFPGAMRFIPPHPASLSRNMNLQAGVLRLLTSGLLGAGNLEYLSVSGSSRQSQINDAIFERIIVPSEAYIRHFCSRRYHLSRDEFAEINLDLFLKILKMSVFHSSTSTFVASLPITLTIVSLSTFLKSDFVRRLFDNLRSMLLMWRLYGPHTSKMGNTVIRALNSEGLDDVLDQALFTFQPDYIRNMPQKYDYFASRVGSNHVKASPTYY